MGAPHYILNHFLMQQLLTAINAGVAPADVLATVFAALDELGGFDAATVAKLNQQYFSIHKRAKK